MPEFRHRHDAKETPTVQNDAQHSHRSQYKPLWNNVVTMAGLFLTAVAIILLLTFGLFSVVSPNPNPYVDIVGYLVLPGILVVGVAIIPFGILFKSWRLRRRDPERRLAFRFPHVDLNDPVQRRAAKVVVLGTFILLPAVALSGYHGYHYTDSAAFCSRACHAAMEPQATTYEHSAHARVGCAECHIGSGASWFVKSKLSGTRQVIAMMEDSFPRPIPPAITELRPAQETCERCHWPKKFFGWQLKEITRFASDEQNTHRRIDVLLNTGGGDESTGRREGIHAHMALAYRIEYIATDERLQEIPWVKWTDAAGNELIYRSDGRPSSDPRPKGKVRQLDCMDCHNRPAHKFRSPQEAVNIYLSIGRISPRLPYIKREAVAALVQPYPDVRTAEAQIGISLTKFYREHYTEQWDSLNALINQAIDNVREIYRRNFFPDMNVSWETYPDNIGHLNSPGCFRCHDGAHVNQRGKALSHRCDVCHTFLNTVESGGQNGMIRKGDFTHPIELKGSHATLRCDRCHSGGTAPVDTCAGCHKIQSEFREGSLAAFAPFAIGPEPMEETVDCQGCHDLSEPTDLETIDAACMDCHDDEEDRFEGMLEAWKLETDDLLRQAETQVAGDDRKLLEALRKAGPLHNLDATRIIIRELTRSSTPLSDPDSGESP